VSILSITRHDGSQYLLGRKSACKNNGYGIHKGMNNNFNPHDVKAAIPETSVEALEADDIFQRAVTLAKDVQALYSFVRETPRWEALWDQAQRASSSVALNYSQGVAKLRGFTQNDWLCSRAELMETFACLSIGPEQFRALKGQVKELLALLDSRILALPSKEDRPYYRN
jgi:hypothetical protein